MKLGRSTRIQKNSISVKWVGSILFALQKPTTQPLSRMALALVRFLEKLSSSVKTRLERSSLFQRKFVSSVPMITNGIKVLLGTLCSVGVVSGISRQTQRSILFGLQVH